MLWMNQVSINNHKKFLIMFTKANLPLQSTQENWILQNINRQLLTKVKINKQTNKQTSTGNFDKGNKQTNTNNCQQWTNTKHKMLANS